MPTSFDPKDISWHAQAYCKGADPNTFVPEYSGKEEDIVVDVIAQYCGRCVVRAECLDFALQNREFGIWGGTTTEERNRLQRRLA